LQREMELKDSRRSKDVASFMPTKTLRFRDYLE
jgi:hypothetical protein